MYIYTLVGKKAIFLAISNTIFILLKQRRNFFQLYFVSIYYVTSAN